MQSKQDIKHKVDPTNMFYLNIESTVQHCRKISLISKKSMNETYRICALHVKKMSNYFTINKFCGNSFKITL